MAKRRIFAVRTPLGYRVILARDRWREIVRFKHPALRGYEHDVQACVADPDFVRRSEKEPEVHLYYRAVERGLLCTVIAGDNPDARFVVTAYFTRSPKTGDDLWTK